MIEKLGQKSSNLFVGILVEMMTPKRHFEINWPLGRESKSQVRFYYYFDPNVQLHAHLEVNDANTEANLVCQALNQLVQQDKCFLFFPYSYFQGIPEKNPSQRHIYSTRCVFTRFLSKKSCIGHFPVESLKVSKNRNDFMKTSSFPKSNEMFLRISALASKMRPNQKNKGTLYHYVNWWILFWLLHYFFHLTSL